MKIGSLFSGYGGLDHGVQAAIGGAVAWVSDVDPGACRILAHRYPDVPNLGDITTVNWSQVEPVDVLTGGFPCQDVSHAGRRAGLHAGTRTGLWSCMADAIDKLRPSLVVAENVRGLLSASATSDLEPCPWCVGDAGGSPLRALGAVLGDLADIGYDARWYGLRAADVGAPHGRFRVFIVAQHANRGAGRPPRPGQGGRSGALAANASRDGRDEGWPEPAGVVGRPDAAVGGAAPQSTSLRLAYAPAVARWEYVLGRPGPAPTEPGRNGNARLNPRFVEWMMGLPDGWVTDVPGLTRNAQLKALGNGVVPQQAAAALRVLLRAETRAAA